MFVLVSYTISFIYRITANVLTFSGYDEVDEFRANQLTAYSVLKFFEYILVECVPLLLHFRFQFKNRKTIVKSEHTASTGAHYTSSTPNTNHQQPELENSQMVSWIAENLPEIN